MKNIFIAILFAMAVMMTWTSQAMALALNPFAYESLSLVVYNASDNEVAVSLMDAGWLKDVQSWAPGTTKMVADPGTVNFSQFDAITSWENLNMAAVSFSWAGDAWFVTTEETRPTTASSTGSFNGAATNAYGWWQTNDTDNDGVSVYTSSYANSYPTTFNLNPPTPGIYAGLNMDYQYGETVLTALDSAGGFAEMYMWHQQAANNIDGMNKPYDAIIRLNSDGSVSVTNPAAVPEPASLLLIGSGLVGLVGLKRMKA